jgi:hypothetical protein
MTFESGFEDAERAAGVATKSATTLVGALRQLQKAADAGELGAMRKAVERVAAVVKSVSQEVENAITAWPFSMEAEERYLRESYVDEFLERARSEAMPVQQLDDGYLLHPSVVRILSAERAVTIDRKRAAMVRPSRLLRKLKAIQAAKPKMGPEQFLELLHRTYRLLVEKQYGRTLPLTAIYDALTLMPGSSAEYGHIEFARDLFLLDRSGITKTKAGATLALPASTGTKGSKGMYSFVSPDGEPVTYYGIQFLEASA